MLKEADEEARLEVGAIAEGHGDFERVADEADEAVSHCHQQNEAEARVDAIHQLTGQSVKTSPVFQLLAGRETDGRVRPRIGRD
jgi:hypothetical protein